MERRKSDSNGKMALLMVLAAFFLIAAIYVIVRVISTIHKDYSMIEQAQESWTETVQTIEIEKEEKKPGWNETMPQENKMGVMPVNRLLITMPVPAWKSS